MKKLFVLLCILFPLMASADGAFRFTGENVSLTVTTTSGVATFGLAGSISAPDIIVYNAGTVPAVVMCGSANTVTAVAPVSGTNGGVLIPPGIAYEMYKGGTKYCAGVTGSSTTTLYFSPGLDAD